MERIEHGMVIKPDAWLVLDNIKQGWPYRTNLRRATADEAYLWLARNGYVKDGRITPAGEAALLTGRAI